MRSNEAVVDRDDLAVLLDGLESFLGSCESMLVRFAVGDKPSQDRCYELRNVCRDLRAKVAKVRADFEDLT